MERIKREEGKERRGEIKEREGRERKGREEKRRERKPFLKAAFREEGTVTLGWEGSFLSCRQKDVN